MQTFDRERWRRTDQVLDGALELDPADRSRYVREACADDPGLRREVEELLAMTAASTGFLAEPAALRAAPLVAAIDRDASSLIGLTLGVYRLVRELGEGGMGVVYLAERVDGEFTHTVALKIAKQGLHSQHARRRFLQERQILANLQHDGIARLLDGGVTVGGIPFFVMERVDGCAITTYCRDCALGVEGRLRKFLNVCDAVQYAHRNLVVHLDLKPSNILVDATGCVKLLDFGIARLLDDHMSAPATTQIRALTPDYAAPEQVSGDPVSTSTDVYALGVVLCELLSGERPYRPRSCAPMELDRAVLQDDPVPPSTLASSRELRRRLKGDLDRIVLKALQKSPDRRYPSAEALAADVRRYLDGLPVLAHGDALSYRARKFLRRHRIGVSAAVLIALTLAGGLVATETQMRRAQREADQSRAVQEFLVSVFSASSPETAKGRPPTARELLDRGAARIDSELKGQPEIRARLQRILARIYGQLGEYESAIPMLESSLAVARQTTGDAIEEADVLDLLALMVYQKSDFKQASILGAKALEVSRRASGPESLQTARIANDVAWIRRRIGEYDEAERLRRFTLDVYRRRLGAEAPETVAVENDLGVLLADIGRFPEAERLERSVLDATRRRLGDEHPDTLNAAYQLSRVLVEFGKPDEAARLLRGTIPVQKRVLGERHDRVATALRMLAWALDDLGQYDEAARDANEALAIQTTSLGPRDAQVAVTLRRRAEIEGHQHRLVEAERDARESLAILIQRFGEDNYDVGATRHVLAWVLLGQGRLSDAADEAERALANRRRYLGDAHPRVADTLDVLGDIEQMQANPARARSLYEQALRIQRDRLGDGHPATLRTRGHLAEMQ
jgi:serine/threonine protein kinase/uncharacterized protein (DUF2267 family)